MKRVAQIALYKNYTPKYPILFCHNLFYRYAEQYKTNYHSDRIKILHQQNFQAYQCINPTNLTQTIQNRAKSFQKKILHILRASKRQKCHIIAHSFAGVDLRCLVGLYEGHKYIESVTTISSPNRSFTLGKRIERGDLGFNARKQDQIIRSLKFVGMGLENSLEFNVQNLNEMNSLCAEPQTPVRFQDCHKIQIFSITGVKSQNQISQFLKHTNKILDDHQYPNDGIIWFQEGKWGVHLTTFNQDHAQIVGISQNYDGKSAFQLAADNIKRVEVQNDQQLRMTLGGIS